MLVLFVELFIFVTIGLLVLAGIGVAILSFVAYIVTITTTNTKRS